MTSRNRRSVLCVLAAAIMLLSGCEWLSYHGGGSRAGVLKAFSGPRSLHRAWSHGLDGAVYASPVVHAGTVYVATEGGSVYAFSSSGSLRWRTHVANPVHLSDLAARGAPCGNIDPLGITGTPVFDPHTGRLFVVAETLINGSVHHQLVALNGRTGAVFARREVSPPRGNSAAHQQRGALALSLGRVLVTYGGLAGDCGNYIGSVVSTRTDLAGPQLSYAIPTTREAGIWTPPGPTVLPDGSILVTSGNGESLGRYDGSDSVVRLSPSLKLLDRFSPTTWPSDNATDLDLGSMGPAVTSNGYVVQAGKRGIVYVLRLSRLSGPGGIFGIGGEVSSADGCAAYGGSAVSGTTVYLPCRTSVRRADIGGDGSIRLGWAAPVGITGSPVLFGNSLLSTSQKTGRLYLLDPSTGAVRSFVVIGAVTRFATPALDVVSGHGRAYVGTQGGIVAVTLS